MTDRLSPMEAIMWRVGQDATLRMTVGALAILDRTPTTEALAERLAFAADNAPRLRRRPDDPTAMRARPSWVDDDDPSPGRHLRSLSVAAPGSMRQLLDLWRCSSRSPSTPIAHRGTSRSSRAWRTDEQRCTCGHITRSRTVSVGSASSACSSTSRRGRVSTARPRRHAHDLRPTPGGNGDRKLGTFTVTVDVPDTVRRLINGVNAARDVSPTDTAVRGVQRVLGVANSVSRQLMVTGGPLSSRPVSRSLFSRFELISIGGARRRLDRPRGQPERPPRGRGGCWSRPLPRRARSPVLRAPPRHADQSAPRPRGGRNWFAPARLEVPTSVGRPGPQFGLVVERLAQARREPALQVASTVAATLGRLPTRLCCRPSTPRPTPSTSPRRRFRDFGRPPPLRIVGSRRIYPLGPRLGCPMNITAFGNDGRLDVGVALDPAAPGAARASDRVPDRRLRQLHLRGCRGASSHNPA